jgi:RHS repeat-associated protein
VQKTFAYTGAELLSSVTHAGVNDPSEMVWDGDGNRVSFTSSTGGTTDFVYDITAGIPAVIEEMIGETPVYYIREPNGALLMRTDGTNYQHYHFDALGSTRMLTDISGNKTDAYAYDAWGQLTDHTAYTGSVEQPYLFVGRAGYYSHYQDPNLFNESGQQLLQLGVRFYDPQTGRFVTRDPIQQGINYYTYVGGLPMSLVDPSGLYTEYVSAEQYQLCKSAGGYLEEWTFCTKKKAMNKWKALKCTGKFCWKWALDAVGCMPQCGLSGLGGPRLFARCVINCMGMKSVDPSQGDDIEEFINCIEESYESQDPRKIKTCTGTINDYNQGVKLAATFLQSAAPIGDDWKRCDKNK